MNARWTILALVLLSPLGASGAGGSAIAQRWEPSVVTLEVSSQQYDYSQPWSRGAQTVIKSGTIIRPQTILTTAMGLANRTVARARSAGRSRWYPVRVTWVDHAANLALVTVEEPEFWHGSKTVTFAETIPQDGDLQVVRWRGGSFEVRQAEFNRFAVNNPTGGDAAHVVLEVNSEINGTGWGEPLISGDELVGLVFSSGGNTCRVLPAPYVRSILRAVDEGSYHGLGYFDFTWQQTENPDTLEYLKLPETSQGVVIVDVPERSPTAKVLKPRDVILEVDGFVIDNQGDYEDPLYGHLMLESLSTHQRWVGDKIPMKIWRDGAACEVEYTLPSVKDAARLVPDAPVDQPPEYLIVGGFVFQPLTRSYLRSWGGDWARSAPFRLAYFRNEEPSEERPSLVVLTAVLPDSINLGYHDSNNLVVDKVNGRRVSQLSELRDALEHPQDGFHLFEFLRGESTQRMVLDAAELETATQRILQRYGIQSPAEIRS